MHEKLSTCVQMDEKAVQTPFDGSGRVHISFPAKLCPSRVVFVLKETEPEAWLNSGAGDFVAQLKPPDLSNLVDKVITAESTYTHWSLFNRFCMANDILDAADAAGERCCWTTVDTLSPMHTELPSVLIPNHCLPCLNCYHSREGQVVLRSPVVQQDFRRHTLLHLQQLVWLGQLGG